MEKLFMDVHEKNSKHKKWKVNLTWLQDYITIDVKLACHPRRWCHLKNRLEEIRKEYGITQAELADILEVSRQTIGSLENGRYNPSILLAFKIATYFNLTIEEIFIYEEGEEDGK